MAANYFEKLVKYTKNVYKIEHGFNKIKDGRVNPTHETSTVLLVILFGLFLRLRSFNEINNYIKRGEFSNLFKKGTHIPRIDTLRDTSKVTYMDELTEQLDFILKKSIRNKVFNNGTIDGYVVAAIDGSQILSSKKKSCINCLKNNDYNHHSCVVMSTIGDNPRLIIGFEMYRPGLDAGTKDEGEITTAKRLVTNVFERKNNFIDVIVYDSLVCNSIWINHCTQYNVDVIIRAKKNKNNAIRKVKREINKMEPVEIWTDKKGFEKVKVYETEFNMPGVEKPLRFVKFTMKRKNNKYSQIMIVTTCMNMSLKTLFKIIRARWDIENAIFNYLKNECHLNHCYVHGGNAVEVMTCLIFIASNLMQLFYYRRLKESFPTRRELVCLLIKGLWFLEYDSKLVFSSA